MADELRVYVRHIRAADLCMNGARMYFAAQGWNWSDFLANGKLVTEIEAVGDDYAIAVAAKAREEE